MAAGLFLACLGAASPALADFGSDVTVKLGASGLYNHRMVSRAGIVGQRQGGGHVSIDFVLPGRSIILSPFLDVYHRVQNDATTTRPLNAAATNVIGGLNFIFTGFRSERATMYMGIGGGGIRLKIAKTALTSAYEHKLMADALMGAELKVAPNVALFVEPHYVWTTKILNGMSTHVGLAFRFGKSEAAPQVRPAPPVYTPRAPVQKATEPPMKPEPLRKVEEVKAQPSSAEATATMQELIYFKHDQSDINDQAKSILNDKVTLFRSTPALRIRIVGFASQPGTDAYNMALGMRRAMAAKAYLVSQGVDETRIEIATRGEGQLAVAGPGEVADAQNRRDQFQLLLAEPPPAQK